MIGVNANFYDEAHNVTCTGDDEGHITCASGHLHEAPKVRNIISPTEII